MPAAIPLLAAAGTAMAGYAAVTAVGATLASQVIGGVMMAGAAMTAVGSITGNQRLTKLGAVASLAGGVSGIMSGAWEGAASLAAQNSASDAAMMDLAGNAAPAASTMTDTGALTASEFAGLQGPSGAQTVVPPTTAGSGTPGMVQPSIATPPAAVATPATGVSGVPNVGATVPNPSAGLTNNPPVPVTQLGSDGGMLGSIKNGIKWMTATPENARISQGLMGMLSSAGAAYSQQEAIKEQLAQQEAVRQRAIDRLNASVKGVKAAPTYVRPGG